MWPLYFPHIGSGLKYPKVQEFQSVHMFVSSHDCFFLETGLHLDVAIDKLCPPSALQWVAEVESLSYQMISRLRWVGLIVGYATLQILVESASCGQITVRIRKARDSTSRDVDFA